MRALTDASALRIALARGDFPGAFALYERAADAGVGAANTRLADFYVYGAPPVSADSAQAGTVPRRSSGPAPNAMPNTVPNRPPGRRAGGVEVTLVMSAGPAVAPGQ